MYRIKKMDNASVVFTLSASLRVWGALTAFFGGLLAMLGTAAAADGVRGASIGVAGMGMVFLFAGLLMLQARKAYPASLVFDNAAQHFIMRGRGGAEAHIGYGEIESIQERHIRERGHMVYLRTRDGGVYDLWNTGWTSSKKGEALARRLNELVKFTGSSEVCAPGALPGWITSAVSGGSRYYAWKDRGAVSRLFMALGLFTGLVLTAAGFSSTDGLSGGALHAVIVVVGAAAAGVMLLSIRMLIGVNVLAVGPAAVRRGRARSIEAAARGLKEKKSMERARLVSVRYSFDTAQGQSEFIMFLDRESFDLLERISLARPSLSDITKALGVYFRIFRLHITGRSAPDLLNFARTLRRECET